jgi:tetratricopeptide (TPR) repeat protein
MRRGATAYFRRTAVIVVLLAICAFTACKPGKPPVVVPPGAPQFPDFVYPAVAVNENSAVAPLQQQAWKLLQAGDLRNAERGFNDLLKQRPAFAPAETGLAYVALAKHQASDALGRFDRVLEHAATYAPALAGRAQALVALGRDEEALSSYEAAAAADPSLDLGPRIEVLRFRGAGDAVQQARHAAEKGDLDAARQAYDRAIAASPDSAFLYRELGTVEAKASHAARALELYRKAAALDPTDARSHVLAGDLLAADGHFDEAQREYTAAAAIEPSHEIDQKLKDVRQRGEIAKLPAEYRAIPTAPEVTRGEVAAVLGVRLAPWLASVRTAQPPLLTDIRTHWAATWILSVVGAGVMEPFPNHTFQPRQRVRRADLARIAVRALDRADDRLTARWRDARLTIPDVPSSHPAYPAISEAIAAGVLRAGDGAAFQPARIATGAELIQAADRLASLLNVSSH